LRPAHPGRPMMQGWRRSPIQGGRSRRAVVSFRICRTLEGPKRFRQITIAPSTAWLRHIYRRSAMPVSRKVQGFGTFDPNPLTERRNQQSLCSACRVLQMNSSRFCYVKYYLQPPCPGEVGRDLIAGVRSTMRPDPRCSCGARIRKTPKHPPLSARVSIALPSSGNDRRAVSPG